MGTKEVRWSFDVMHRDTLCTHVDVMSDLNIEFKNFTDDIFITAFGREKEVDFTMLEEFFESRCFERGRADKDELLRGLGLNSYEPLDIARITHGVLIDDFTWIRFEGETLTWHDICEMYRIGLPN